MKVNSDAILLGSAFSSNNSIHKVLDIGTGTGIIALMAAQRLENNIPLNITAIDIDAPSIEEAKVNFNSSPWKDSFKADLCPLMEFERQHPQELFDLILSNPPYYDNSLIAKGESRNAARHTDVENGDALSLNWADILEYANNHLCESGIVSMILPYDFIDHVKRYGKKVGLSHLKTLIIKTTETKRPKRMIIEFIKASDITAKESTLILLEKGKRTQEYISLTEAFYI